MDLKQEWTESFNDLCKMCNVPEDGRPHVGRAFMAGALVTARVLGDRDDMWQVAEWGVEQGFIREKPPEHPAFDRTN